MSLTTLKWSISTSARASGLPVRTARLISAVASCSQVEAFSRDDAAAAYSYASPGIHEMFPQADAFLGMVQRRNAPVYRHKSFEFGDARSADGKIAQAVHIVDSDGVPWEALYTLEQQSDGSIKISGCVLIKSGQGA